MYVCVFFFAGSASLCGRYVEAVARFDAVADLRLVDFCWWALASYHSKEALANGTCIQRRWTFAAANCLGMHSLFLSIFLHALIFARTYVFPLPHGLPEQINLLFGTLRRNVWKKP